MFRTTIFYDNLTDSLSATWVALTLQGVFLVALGIAIAWYPELLVAMVSATFILLGVLSLFIGLLTRSLRSKYRKWKTDLWEPM